MQSARQISIAVPTYNRCDETIDSFVDVYSDARISEIVIVDDFSNVETYNDLKELSDFIKKCRLFRNESNRDCYRNKQTAMSFVSNDWAILFDSDNKLDERYVDLLFQIEKWDERTIYTPSFASPHFDFRAYSGMEVSNSNVGEFIDKPMFEVMLNACNYFVNKNEYLKIWDGSIDPVTSDSIYFCLKWLEAGNKIKVVDGLTYTHTVHDGSHYKTNNHRTPVGFHQSILKRLRELS